MGKSRGFNLVELMIVAAIIAALAAIAIPQYHQQYTARAYAASALAEITPSRNQFEIKINDGITNPAD